jgi:hypothetical protein
MNVGNGLRLHALRGINDHQSAFTGAEAAGYFIREIHVSRGINQVQLVDLSVLGLVIHRDRMRLDRDASLTLQIHGIQELFLHFAGRDGSGAMQQPIRERRLPVIDVSNNAEITYMSQIH